MKKGIGYIRISTKDQSNFSIPGQTDFITQYCQRKDIALINNFIDNGQSAKNFDRADWKKLENFVKSNYRDIDYLIVVKYDRFSRNVAEGLNMIEKLEKKYGISVLSVFEEIAINPESPFFFKMRTDMLVQAEFELRVIRERTRFGVKQAKKEGRWLHTAPYAYVNKRDQQNKPIIEIQLDVNEKGWTRPDIVREIYALWLKKTPLKRIEAHVKNLGFPHTKHGAIAKILKNPAYCGMVKHGEDMYKGLHEPIIDLDTFNMAQAMFPRQSKIKVLLNDEVPLRGVLRCSCGRFLTAGKSKGKAKYYWYYKCMAHLEMNYNSEAIHKKLKEVLQGLSFTDEQLNEIKSKAKEKIQKEIKEFNSPQVQKSIKDLEAKIRSLESKFISEQINFETYSRWNTEYNKELGDLREKQRVSEQSRSEIWDKFNKYTHNLKSLWDVYNDFSITQKQRMVNILFNYTLRYQLNTFLVGQILPEFALQAASLKEKGLIKITRPLEISGKNPLCTREGTILELFDLFKELETRNRG